uniref:class II aldolase/adducin family protein n=1 Tax=Okeania sp. SIO2F4 TaxID=2607790 RepID=UPI0025E8A7A0|nr:class II aldolase/adducin family protein [Okeania sp. SIO2F4]
MNVKTKSSNLNNPITPFYSEEERNLRIELAAAYRLIHHYGMTDMTYTHISVRIKEEPPIFLTNAYGMMFDEICDQIWFQWMLMATKLTRQTRK